MREIFFNEFAIGRLEKLDRCRPTNLQKQPYSWKFGKFQLNRLYKLALVMCCIVNFKKYFTI